MIHLSLHHVRLHHRFWRGGCRTGGRGTLLKNIKWDDKERFSHQTKIWLYVLKIKCSPQTNKRRTNLASKLASFLQPLHLISKVVGDLLRSQHRLLEFWGKKKSSTGGTALKSIAVDTLLTLDTVVKKQTFLNFWSFCIWITSLKPRGCGLQPACNSVKF